MNQNHIITIDEEIESMKTRMKESPKLLQKSAGNKSCCVFRVPQSLLEINKEAYEPRIVSIGPYHHGKKDLEMIQEHKWRFLQDMLTRTGKTLGFFMNIMVSLDNEIRESYSESIDRFTTNDLAKMMVLDGVFLIELFRKVGKLVHTQADDPIFKMGWISPFLMRDLLRIENQIPFFVLKKLFEESNSNSRTLQSLILEFFNHIVERPQEVLKKCENLDGKHLLDFFRKSFIHTKKTSVTVPKMIDKTKSVSPKLVHPTTEIDETKSLSPKLIRPATKLVNAGVKFKAIHQAQSFLDIEFKNGLLLIPQINMDDFHSSFFMNCMAFEQCCCYCSKDITTYVVFMGCVMHTSTDVGILSQHKIIENYFGTDKEIAKFFKEVGKDVAFDVKDHYLGDLFMGVNEYCENGWHVGWAGFRHTYFESPWAFISALAAFMLLSLATLQTFYTVFPYYHKNGK
ncbi:hypothetical protein R6Q59_030725 [Mikania micrantha]|uniref:Uncharacterized protein n=1 Tax=Mikania micrantha TaxID=192012 RepID=A0A5N6NZF1_9ASTR|nr:hypothetical protein E3N88_16348 [Mikania micrantha]